MSAVASHAAVGMMVSYCFANRMISRRLDAMLSPKCTTSFQMLRRLEDAGCVLGEFRPGLSDLHRGLGSSVSLNNIRELSNLSSCSVKKQSPGVKGRHEATAWVERS